MKNIDYGWVIGLVAVVLLVLFWKPLTGMFGGIADKATNKEQYERGKVVFYDVERWDGKGSYKSCAMCHAPDFVPDPGKEIKMASYKAGEPFILKGIGSKYSGGTLGTSDVLFEACMNCLQSGDKMGCGRVSMQAPFMQDLLNYVSKQ